MLNLKNPEPVAPSTIKQIKAKERKGAALVKRRLWLGGKRIHGVFLALERAIKRVTLLGANHLRNVGLSAKLENYAPEQMGYTATQEVETFLLYRNEVFGKMPVPTGEYHRDQIETIAGLLEADSSIDWVVNFGVSYGHVDAILAKKFPSVTFYGVDRSPFVKALNEVDFGDVPNLKFVADDIVEFMKRMNRTDGGLLFHARTGTLLHPLELDDIYGNARKHGLHTVVGFEPHGVSRTTFEEFKYTVHGRVTSQPYRRSMYLHNYPLILRGNRFTVTEFRYQSLPSPDGDGSKITFVATLDR